jgi:hypothetical protein
MVESSSRDALQFVFMLTRNDMTVPNALEAYKEVRECALRYVGFKDVGLPVSRLQQLAERIHADGREVMLEVVSERADDELRSIQVALEIGADWVLGGTHPDAALPLIEGRPIRYCPFPGRVIGHPSLLLGTIAEVAADARRLTAMPGVHGLDLLAYRFDGDVTTLMAEVVAAAGGPVIAAGSIDSLERIRAVERSGAWGFTIGGAIFDGRLPGGPSLSGQVDAVLSAIGEPRPAR